MKTLLVATTTLALALSGCIGFGGGDRRNDTDNGTLPDDDDDNATSGPDGVWHYDNRTGEVQGAGLVVLATGGQQEPFNVTNGTIELRLTLQAEMGELVMYVAPPGCEEGAACEESVETSDGQANYSEPGPDAGSWRIRIEPMFAADTAYDLTIATLVPAGTEAMGDDAEI